MQKNFKLTIEYDGTHFHGWQRQLTDRTIQGEIERALCKICNEKITLIGSGRTDAGVHALGQTANFRSSSRLGADEFQKALNSLLSSDIVIRACEAAAESFHARFDACSKIYNYRILNRKIPMAIGRQYVWFIPLDLDLPAIQSAMAHLKGEHDFKAFEGTGSPRAHTVRNIYRIDLIEKKEGCVIFEIQANGFLRFMVRNIVGTLVDVGLGRTEADEVKNILMSRDRGRAGATAPPQGLFLMQVCYDQP
ncbi:MAG: tRNA pseudouridine(38-40) synthase TruA [Desulfobacteraceae bacterium 4572_123]|nr:MAG: tRNA pseudouridine(38-40) synthase TruA [Desulfobacteraceae bacterium 4572_123]